MASLPSLHHCWTWFRAWTSGLTLLQWLRLFCLVLVWWSEVIRYTLVFPCHWDDTSLIGHTSSKPTHILVLTDPRVRYAPILKYSLFGSPYQWFYELSLRKTWSAALALNPHIVIFMGDMLASGRKVKSSDDFDLYFKSFTRLFPVKKNTRAYFVPGNEDIGLNLKNSDAQRARLNYIEQFGPPNLELSVSNHTLVLLDAPGLVEEDYQRAQSFKEYSDWAPLPSGPVDFVRSLEDLDTDQPRVLFSHIPLARSETASCGPLRVKGGIHRGAGPGYQNMLGKQTTEFLLQTIRPAVVFSGDDRDYCEVRHTVSYDGADTFVPEITVKSFSPVKDIPTVGFHLLSMIPPPEDLDLRMLPTFAHSPCFLPAPIRVYGSVYFPTLSVIMLISLVRQYRKARLGRGRYLPADDLISPLPSAFPPGTSRTTIPMSPFTERGHKSAFSRGHRLQISVDRTNEAVTSRVPPSWSWTFNFRGRRRRFTLRQPRLRVPIVSSLLSRLGKRLDALPWSHSMFATIGYELLYVLWPSVALWMFLAWWTM